MPEGSDFFGRSSYMITKYYIVNYFGGKKFDKDTRFLQCNVVEANVRDSA